MPAVILFPIAQDFAIDVVGDVKEYLSGTVFLIEFCPCAERYNDSEKPYSGNIWELPDGEK